MRDHPAMTERGPRAVPRSGSECAAPRCARGALRCSRHKGGCGTARRGAERATTSWLLAGPSPAAPDFPLRRCASRRPIFAPAGYRPRAVETLVVFSANTSVHRQSRGRVCVGSDICGAEERRAHGRARQRASSSDSSRLAERSERSERSEFRDGPCDRAPQGTLRTAEGCRIRAPAHTRPRLCLLARNPTT
jgi:hypothetical protein